MNIREETDLDFDGITNVTKKAFKESEHGDNNEDQIIIALRNSGNLTFSLVAEIEDKIIGHVAVSPVTISDGTNKLYGLGPISVDPVHQKNGIGSALMKTALDKLKHKNANGCVLLGDPNYYSRFGFKVNSKITFPGVPAKYFQFISFTANEPSGEVTYHKSFYDGV